MIRQNSQYENSNTNPITTLIKPEIFAKKIRVPALYGLKFSALILIFILSTSYQSPNSPFREKALELYLRPFQTSMLGQLEKFQKENTGAVSTVEENIKTLSFDFYRQEDYLPVWTLNFDLTENSTEMLNLLTNANNYGLNPEDYSINRIKKLGQKLQQDKNKDKKLKIRQEFELSLTAASFKFMVNINRGCIKNDTSLTYRNYLSSLPIILNTAIRKNSVTKNILALQPDNYEYKLLQKALVKFLKTVHLDDKDVSIPSPEKDLMTCNKLAKLRLTGLGFLNASLADNDSNFVAALQQFQKFYGLDPDGKIGYRTRKALEKSSKYRFEQIALNLDRLRKEYNFSQHYAYVNIPAFELKLVKNNVPQKSFRVIVGKPGTPTPELSSQIERIITHPYWIVPKSIAVKEILPKLKEDSTYLAKHRFNLIDKNKNNISYDNIDWNDVTAADFNFVFRQDASRNNALGEIKFIFPNKYSVYLHDTPSKRLFKKNARAFSHGCIRLENPEIFAEYLARDNISDQQNDSIFNLLKNGVHEEINLQEPLDVYIRYLTCSADEQLNLYFYNDIYNKDAAQIDSLFN
jgi:L,D-transpeptidase YcbB